MNVQSDQARLRDEEARALIRLRLDATMLVEAGAGTGKTRALVERYTSHVLAGTRVERIIAITFTEKAAAELKDRIRGELERLSLTPADDTQADLLQAALGTLDRARISTIHAFGLSLMRQYAAEAGVDPSFSVQDEMLAERRFDEAWMNELHRLSGVPQAGASFEQALMLGMAPRDLHELARAIALQPGLADVLHANPSAAPAIVWPDLDALAAALDALGLEHRPEDLLRTRVEALRAALQRIINASDREQALATSAALAQRKVGANVRGWPRDEQKLTTDTANGVAEELASTLAALRARALARLLPFVCEFVRGYMDACRREGTLTFDELIYGPAVLLAHRPVARDTLRATYDVMLIDEFQDTDPLQVEIALAFATDPATGALEPGRLVLVGDPKQSIYRFRRADIGVYERTSARLREASAEAPILALNRRSRREIIDWVNQVFTPIIGDGSVPELQPPYRRIDHERDVPLKGPGVAVLGEHSALAARDLRRHEATQIAGWCEAAIADGWEVEERESKVIRRARYRDIAILLPTRAGLSALERALRAAGIPFRVEGGSLIYQTQEVRDLINALAAVDDPSDEVAIVAALRSPAFACSDADLARWKSRGGRFNYLARDIKDRDGPVSAGLLALARWHDERHERSLAALVERFIAEHGLDETALLADGTRDGFRRLRYVVEQARAFEANGPETLRAFVAWMEHRAGAAILDREGAALDDDEDAVRILTIHGSKGLEFPIVFVAGLGVVPGYNRPTVARDRGSDAVAFHLGTKSKGNVFDLGEVERLHKLEDEHGKAERDRLLYVAATRARDHLVSSLYRNSRQSNSAAARLEANGARDGAVALEELALPPRAETTPFADLVIESQDLAEDKLREQRQALLSRAITRRYTSATALKLAMRQDGEKQERDDETEPWAKGRGGTRLGRAVHAAIQSLPLDADASLVEAHARAQSLAEAIPHRQHDVSPLVSRALASDAAARARAARRALREVPFAARRDGTVIEGFIDMLIEQPDGLEIVDWKTDQISAGDVPARLREYELQAGLYVMGVEAATGRPVTRITYVFVSAGVEASPGEPRTLADAALAALEQVA